MASGYTHQPVVLTPSDKAKAKKLTNKVDVQLASLAKNIRDLLWKEKIIASKDSNFDLHLNSIKLRRLRKKITSSFTDQDKLLNHIYIALDALVAVAHQRNSLWLRDY